MARLASTLIVVALIISPLLAFRSPVQIDANMHVVGGAGVSNGEEKSCLQEAADFRSKSECEAHANMVWKSTSWLFWSKVCVCRESTQCFVAGTVDGCLEGEPYKEAVLDRLRAEAVGANMMAYEGCLNHLWSVGADLTGDKDFMLRAKVADPRCKCYSASPHLMADKDFVLKMMNISNQQHQTADGCFHAAVGADIKLASDQEFILQAMSIQHSGRILKYVDQGLQRDRQFLLKVCNATNSESLKYAPDEIRADKGFIMEALSLPKPPWGRDSHLFDGLADDLKRDPDVALLAVNTMRELVGSLSGVPDELKQNKAFCLGLLEVFMGGLGVPWEGPGSHFYPDGILFAADELKADKSFMLQAVSINPDLYDYASDALKGDAELVWATVQRYPQPAGGCWECVGKLKAENIPPEFKPLYQKLCADDPYRSGPIYFMCEDICVKGKYTVCAKIP